MRGQAHPVDDFLFTYYPFSMRKLTQWHPGPGIAIEHDDSVPDWLTRPPYQTQEGWTLLNPASLSAKQVMRIRWIRDLLVATQNRPPYFGCHGLHEWAMVYGGEQVRHGETCPLRLPQSEIDQIVENRPLFCSHFDAFRFFQPAAQPLNRMQPDMDSRMANEQPGCLHVGMDLYKWASKSMPWVSSDLQLRCFELAVGLRSLDMRASPYDLSEFGLEPVKIETSEGRRLYETEQRRLAEEAAPLRDYLIEALSQTIQAVG